MKLPEADTAIERYVHSEVEAVRQEATLAYFRLSRDGTSFQLAVDLLNGNDDKLTRLSLLHLLQRNSLEILESLKANPDALDESVRQVVGKFEG